MKTWILFATVLTIMNILAFLIIKQVQDDGILVTCYVSITVTILSLATLMYLYTNKQNIVPKHLSLIVGIGIISFFGSIMLLSAISYAENPSFVRAFVSIEIVALFLIYALIKHQKPCMNQLIGVLLVGAGIYIITIS